MFQLNQPGCGILKTLMTITNNVIRVEWDKLSGGKVSQALATTVVTFADELLSMMNAIQSRRTGQVETVSHIMGTRVSFVLQKLVNS